MHQDDLWARETTRGIEKRSTEFSEKQLRSYEIPLLLRVIRRVADFSEHCKTCRSYQHTLTRLMEEVRELPGSKAQRQYQAAQLREFSAHLRQEHQLVTRRYFVRTGLRAGLLLGIVIGMALFVFLSTNALALVLPVGLGPALGLAVGNMLAAQAEQAQRLV